MISYEEHLNGIRLRHEEDLASDLQGVGQDGQGQMGCVGGASRGKIGLMVKRNTESQAHPNMGNIISGGSEPSTPGGVQVEAGLRIWQRCCRALLLLQLPFVLFSPPHCAPDILGSLLVVSKPHQGPLHVLSPLPGKLFP